MAFSVCLLPEAEQDFDEAVAGHGGLQAGLAIRFYSGVADAISALEDHPTHYGYYVENYRRILLETFPLPDRILHGRIKDFGFCYFSYQQKR